jgi:hypothetical protein
LTLVSYLNLLLLNHTFLIHTLLAYSDYSLHSNVTNQSYL